MSTVQEVIDGELSVRVFGLLRVVDVGMMSMRHSEVTRQRLDLSLLSFLQCFRKVYIGEQVMHSSKVGLVANSDDMHLQETDISRPRQADQLKVFGTFYQCNSDAPAR